MPGGIRKTVGLTLAVLTVLFAVVTVLFAMFAAQGLGAAAAHAAVLAPSGPTPTPTPTTTPTAASTNPPPATSVTLVLDPQGPLSTRTAVTLVAELTPSSARGEVRFYDDGRLLDSGGPFRIDGVWTGESWTVGVHDLTAQFEPDENTGTPSSSQVAVLTIPAGEPAVVATASTPSPSASDSQNIAVTVPPSSVLATETESAPSSSSSPPASPTPVTTGEVLGEGFGTQGTLPHTGLDVIALLLAAALALSCGVLLRAAGSRRGRHTR